MKQPDTQLRNALVSWAIQNPIIDRLFWKEIFAVRDSEGGSGSEDGPSPKRVQPVTQSMSTRHWVCTMRTAHDQNTSPVQTEACPGHQTCH